MATASGRRRAWRRKVARALRWGRNLLRRLRDSSPAGGDAPDFWRSLGNELAAGRQWMDRSVVLAYAAITGLAVVGFTLLAEAASHGFELLRGAGPAGPWLTLLWTPALTVAVLWWTHRFAPGAMGSGIPQVVRALDDDLLRAQRGWRCTRWGWCRRACWRGCRSAARGPRCRWALA